MCHLPPASASDAFTERALAAALPGSALHDAQQLGGSGGGGPGGGGGSCCIVRPRCDVVVEWRVPLRAFAQALVLAQRTKRKQKQIQQQHKGGHDAGNTAGDDGADDGGDDADAALLRHAVEASDRSLCRGEETRS